LDQDPDRVSQAVCASPAPAGHRRPQLVELEIVAGQAPRGQVALEDVSEPDEQARGDDADDLALERVVPAALVPRRLELPGQAEVVCQMLQLSGFPLPRRGVLREAIEVAGWRIVGEAELAQQRAGDDELRVAPA